MPSAPELARDEGACGSEGCALSFLQVRARRAGRANSSESYSTISSNGFSPVQNGSLLSSRFAAADDPGVRIIGRHHLRRCPPAGADFDFPGVQIVARFLMTSWAVAVMSQAGGNRSLYMPNSFAVYVDSVLHTTFNTSDWFQQPRVRVPLFSGLDPVRPHDVTIFKRTEPQYNSERILPNYVTFLGFEGPSGMVLQPSVAGASRKIEFLGDSITAGFCNLCQPSPANASNSWDNENHELAYPILICRALGAQCHVEAWSGYGMYVNCCGQPMSASQPMSSLWRRAVASQQSPSAMTPWATPADNLWNFRSWVPDALVINLGTNDVAGGWPWVVPNYNATYLALVQEAALTYGLSTHFFLACGPMTDKLCDAVQWVVAQARASVPGLKVTYWDLTHFLNGTYGPACFSHPSAQVHAAMAKAGVAVIGEAMGWS